MNYFKLTHNLAVVVLVVLVVVVFVFGVSEAAVEVLQHFADELDEVRDQSQRTGREYTLVTDYLAAGPRLVVIFVVGHDHAVALPVKKTRTSK